MCTELIVQTLASRTIFIRHILILSSYLRLYTPNDLFPLGFLLKSLAISPVSLSIYLSCTPHTLSFHHYKIYYIYCDKITKLWISQVTCLDLYIVSLYLYFMMERIIPRHKVLDELLRSVGGLGNWQLLWHSLQQQ